MLEPKKPDEPAGSSLKSGTTQQSKGGQKGASGSTKTKQK